MLVNRKELLKKLQLVAPGLDKKAGIEQSSHFVFSDARVFTFNDKVSCSMEIDLGFTGAIVADPLLKLLSKLTEDEINLDVVDGELIVKGKRRKAGLRLEEEISLPIDVIETADEWEKLPDDFSGALSLVLSCVGTDDSHFILSCVHLAPKWLESSDDFQLIRYKLDMPFKESVLVRGDSLKSICNLGLAEVCKTDNWLHFKTNSGMVVSCRRDILEGEEVFPDISEHLKMEGEETSLPKGMESIIDRVRIFSKEGTGNDLVQVDMKKDKIKITGSGENGWYTEIEEAKYDGEEISFSIDPKLLLEIGKKSQVCEIGEGRMRVKTERWTYVTCTYNKEEEEEEEEQDS
jgi:hypothetical protein